MVLVQTSVSPKLFNPVAPFERELGLETVDACLKLVQCRGQHIAAVSPWATYGAGSVNLTTSMQSYSFSFTSPSGDSASVFELDFGGANPNVYVDNVVLMQN